MQVSIRSNNGVGLSFNWICCCIHCGWLSLYLLPLSRKICTKGSLIRKHLLACFLHYCSVSLLHSFFHNFKLLCYVSNTLFTYSLSVSKSHRCMASLGAALLIWPTVTEQLHLKNKVHHNLNTTCPTAKTGLLGGGALVSLCSSLFWLISHMLTDNAREDYLEEEADRKGKYGVKTTADFDDVAARA